MNNISIHVKYLTICDILVFIISFYRY